MVLAVRIIRHFWQSLVRRFEQPARRSAGEFKRGLSASRQERKALLRQVSGLQDDLEHLKSQDEQLRAELRERFDLFQAERDAAQQELMGLRASLSDAQSRQETAETLLNTLEFRLQEQRREQQAALEQSRGREHRQSRRLNMAMTVAAAAFLLGILGGAITFWQVRNTTRLLAEVSQGIKGIQTSMEGQSVGNAPVQPQASSPATPEDHAATRSPESRPAVDEKASHEQDDAVRGSAGQKLPEPDFIASKSLPLNDHTFRNRQDTRAFFEENAGQPGVVTLPSGLQYRVLIPGAGRSPSTTDRVTVEYRAFRPDGTETDNSFTEDLPTMFTVEETIPALEEALPRMQEGAQWELYIPPNLAFPGARKRGPHGFEPLILTVELISVIAADSANQR
jgi:FKBP-type peptidyl-prolyl cis-trans isomerase FklB